MNKRETISKGAVDKNIILNSKVKDSSSKVIFDDNTLCAQFMMDYVEALKGLTIHPDDLEDVSSRYVPLIAEERNSDTVKKVKIANEMPFYFVSLIEHKTQVDYNVSIQIFRYIYQIWEDYEKEMEKKQNDISKTKSFRYPPVIPIVYYEGTDKWTASRELRDRIAMQEMFGDMIPNFTYQLVSLNKYSNQELLDKGDEISIMMLINKIQDQDSIKAFMEVGNEELLNIIKGFPRHIVSLIANILRVCLHSMNLSEDEVEHIASKVEGKKMGRLFEGVTLDIQAERKKLEEEKQAVEEERQAMEAMKAREQRRILSFIKSSKADGKSEAQIIKNLQDIFELDEMTAKAQLEQWIEEV